MKRENRRMALVLTLHNHVAWLNDEKFTHDRIELIDEHGKLTEEALLTRATPAGLAGELIEAGVTDLVAEHIEEGVFNAVKAAGIKLWLGPPGLERNDAIEQWMQEKLPEARVAAQKTPAAPEHPVPSAKHHHSRGRDRGVDAPVRGGRLPGF
ncbi:MAG: hypothetical protein IPK87_09290 [Planctomycetes bacterium]|nr:hypothetical protein [Planctomycetota bacterium]